MAMDRSIQWEPICCGNGRSSYQDIMKLLGNFLTGNELTTGCGEGTSVQV